MLQFNHFSDSLKMHILFTDTPLVPTLFKCVVANWQVPRSLVHFGLSNLCRDDAETA